MFSRPFNLWVSLPRNDVDLARAALEGGADALKIHLGVQHFASGTDFGAFEEEKEKIAKIVETAQGRPVGIVPGDSPEAAPELLRDVANLGLAFAFIYSHQCPASWLVTDPPLPLGLAPNYQYPKDLISHLAMPGVFAIEASVMPRERYGGVVTAADLALYRFIREQTKLPLVVPTQLKWKPEDVPTLRTLGIDALMIGAVVTGDTAKGVYESTQSFKKVVEKL